MNRRFYIGSACNTHNGYCKSLTFLSTKKLPQEVHKKFLLPVHTVFIRRRLDLRSFNHVLRMDRIYCKFEHADVYDLRLICDNQIPFLFTLLALIYCQSKQIFSHISKYYLMFSASTSYQGI